MIDKSCFGGVEFCAREYRKLDNVFFKDVYAKNKDTSLLDRTIYVFADQESIVLDALLKGEGYTIEKMNRVETGSKPPFEKIYVVVLNAIGHRHLNVDYRASVYRKRRTALAVNNAKMVAGR